MDVQQVTMGTGSSKKQNPLQPKGPSTKSTKGGDSAERSGTASTNRSRDSNTRLTSKESEQVETTDNTAVDSSPYGKQIDSGEKHNHDEAVYETTKENGNVSKQDTDLKDGTSIAPNNEVSASNTQEANINANMQQYDTAPLKKSDAVSNMDRDNDTGVTKTDNTVSSDKERSDAIEESSGGESSPASFHGYIANVSPLDNSVSTMNDNVQLANGGKHSESDPANDGETQLSPTQVQRIIRTPASPTTNTAMPATTTISPTTVVTPTKATSPLTKHETDDVTAIQNPVTPLAGNNIIGEKPEASTPDSATEPIVKSAQTDKGRPKYSKDTEYQRRWYHNEFSDDLTVNLVAFEISRDLDHAQEEPLAYRDSNGNMRLYQPGQEPSVLVKDYSFDGLSGQMRFQREEPEVYQRQPEVNEMFHLDKRRLDVKSVIREESGEITDSKDQISDSQSDTAHSTKSPMETENDDMSDVTYPLEIPGPRPPKKRRFDLIPDENRFVEIDLHAIKAPSLWKDNLSQLVLYLTDLAYTPLEQVRSFYMWITHNINYDTSTFFARTKPQSTDPYSVLKSRLTVCEGYTNLFQALCREVGIHAVTITGVVKGNGYRPSDDIFHERQNAHAWNAVLLDNDWFLIDTTWGAGFVKTKERKYVARFNNVYFLTDPDIFISDHYPLRVDGKQTDIDRWQLLDQPVSKDKFKAMLNMEKHGKEWYVNAVSHKKAIIQNVDTDIDVVLTETLIPMQDYVAFLYKGDQKLEQFTFTYKPNQREVIIHVCMPSFGYFTLHIYGRRKVDARDVDYQPLVKYTINCNGSPAKDVLPYPSHHTCYGPSEDLALFGIHDCGDVFQKAVRGEVTLPVHMTHFVDIFPRLTYEEYTTVLHEYCLINYSDDYSVVNLNVRLPYKGYYKLMLFGKKNESGPTLNPFMTYLVDSRTGSSSEAFPVQLEHALRNKCCLIRPLTKVLRPDSEVAVSLKSPFLQMVKCNDTLLSKVDDLFEGVVEMPAIGSDVIIYGAESKEDFFHPMYSFKTA